MIYEEIKKIAIKNLKEIGLAELDYQSINENSSVYIPGVGSSGDGLSYSRNRLSLEKYYLTPKLINDNFMPESDITLFNQKISVPALAAPMSGITTNLRDTINEQEFLTSVLEGCNISNTIGMCGDSNDTTNDYIVPEILKNQRGIAVCKPRSIDEIIRRIELLQQSDPVAIGVDLDGLGGVHLFNNNMVSLKSIKELEIIRRRIKGPAFLKGIMSQEDAKIAYELGYDGIVISNHGGRSIDYCRGVADVLPEISRKFKGKMKIFVDGGVRNGYDVFIYIALGADAVLIGRSVLYAIIGYGAEGVKVFFEKITQEFKKTMIFTNCRNVGEIDDKLLGIY